MTSQITNRFASLLLILVLGIGSFPSLSFANNGNGQREKRERKEPRTERLAIADHDDDDDEDDDNDDESKLQKKIEKLERKATKEHLKACRKAFKNLFKFGNIGTNASNFYIECLAKVGFEAKFVGTPTTTPPSTPDTTAPIISSISIVPATTSASITWHTNENADSAIFWNTSSNVDLNSTTTLNSTDSSKVNNHALTASSLSASTTYYLIVRSRDNSGNTATSSVMSFTTLGAVIPPIDNIAPIVTNVSATTSTSTVQVSWNTNELATSRVYYSTSSSIDANSSTTSFIENVTLTLNHLLSLVNLLPETIYYLIVRSVDGSGNATTTGAFTATTTASI